MKIKYEDGYNTGTAYSFMKPVYNTTHHRIKTPLGATVQGRKFQGNDQKVVLYRKKDPSTEQCSPGTGPKTAASATKTKTAYTKIKPARHLYIET